MNKPTITDWEITPRDAAQVSDEILRNGGWTDREIESLPFFIVWRTKKTRQPRHDRFGSREAALLSLAGHGLKERPVLQHNIPED
jgi:hypothetical protein